MYQLSNNNGDLSNYAGQSTIPGKATLKALSILSFPFLHNAALPEGPTKVKELTKELEAEIEALRERITLMKLTKENVTQSNAAEKIEEDIPMPSKAQGMVQHLKHTHTKNNN